jgi:hypothetical protein
VISNLIETFDVSLAPSLTSAQHSFSRQSQTCLHHKFRIFFLPGEDLDHEGAEVVRVEIPLDLLSMGDRRLELNTSTTSPFSQQTQMPLFRA